MAASRAAQAPGSANPMRRVALRNIAAHKLRLVLSVLAVVLGTAFVTGSLVFTATLQGTFDRLISAGTENISAQVVPEDPRGIGVPVGIVDEIRELPGVAKAQDMSAGSVVLMDSSGEPVQTGGAPSEGFAWRDDAISTVDEISSGRAPAADDEIVLPENVLEKAGLAIDGPAQVFTTSDGLLDVTVVGAYTTASDVGGYVGAGFTEAAARALFTDGEHVQRISVQADEGVSEEEIRDTIAAEYPDLTVKTGDEVREEAADQLSTVLDFINYFFVAFGLIALLVGTFIIYNTFSMLVAQRMRELALLRSIGASRRQLTTTVLGEAALTGLVGSALGVVAGFGLARAIFWILDALDLGIPSGGLALTPTSVLVPLVLGVVVTVFSAWAPARRAGRVAPVQGMRVGAGSETAGGGWRTALGGYLAVIGVLVALIGTWQDTTRSGAITVGIGALALIVGAFLLMPALARPIAGGIGRVLGAPFGSVGRLAATNAGRNTRRTAATAFALTLGLALVSAFGTLGATTKASIEGMIDQGSSADVIVQGIANQGPPTPLPGTIQDDVAAVDGVDTVVWFGFGYGILGGEPGMLAGLGGPVDELIDANLDSGRLAAEGDSLVVSRDIARSKGWTMGSRVPLVGPDGTERTLTVTGVYRDAELLSPYYTSTEVFEDLVPENLRTTSMVLVGGADGVDPERLRDDVAAAVADTPIAQVQTQGEMIEQNLSGIDQLLTIIYALLGLALVIAVLGIVNTLALSVIERRTEIGMLRAVGMQRSQVRRTINLESTQIAVFGALVGAVIGVYLGWAFVSVLAADGLQETTIPWGTIGIVLACSAIVGVLASLWPAHRAARTDPLEAIAD